MTGILHHTGHFASNRHVPRTTLRRAAALSAALWRAILASGLRFRDLSRGNDLLLSRGPRPSRRQPRLQFGQEPLFRPVIAGHHLIQVHRPRLPRRRLGFPHGAQG